jgi:hypothetical protein
MPQTAPTAKRANSIGDRTEKITAAAPDARLPLCVDWSL